MITSAIVLFSVIVSMILWIGDEFESCDEKRNCRRVSRSSDKIIDKIAWGKLGTNYMIWRHNLLRRAIQSEVFLGAAISPPPTVKEVAFHSLIHGGGFQSDSSVTPSKSTEESYW